jgi:tetratricopeptide (TPR) repeat protein
MSTDYLEEAKGIYNHPSPPNTRASREVLEGGLPTDTDRDHRKQALTLYAEVLCCDYLNRFNDADERNLELARQSLDEAAEIDPDYLWMHYTRGLMYRGFGEHQKSLEAFARVLQTNPGIARAHTNMAAEMLYVGQPLDALGALERAIEQIPPSSHHYDMICWYRGRVFHYLRLWTDAIHWLSEAVRRRPFVWFTRAYLISALIEAGHRDEAMEAVIAFHEAMPGYDLARIKHNQNDHDDDTEAMRRQRETMIADLERVGF